MEKNNLKITISGVAGSGKSHAMHIIIDALESAGYEIGKHRAFDGFSAVPADQEELIVSVTF